VQAQSFAKAMRTDIFSTFFSIGAKIQVQMTGPLARLLMHLERQNYWLSSNTLTLFGCLHSKKLPIFSGQSAKRPELELFARRLFTALAHFHSF
jgi:hypothetical protein